MRPTRARCYLKRRRQGEDGVAASATEVTCGNEYRHPGPPRLHHSPLSVSTITATSLHLRILTAPFPRGDTFVGNSATLSTVRLRVLAGDVTAVDCAERLCGETPATHLGPDRRRQHYCRPPGVGREPDRGLCRLSTAAARGDASGDRARPRGGWREVREQAGVGGVHLDASLTGRSIPHGSVSYRCQLLALPLGPCRLVRSKSITDAASVAVHRAAHRFPSFSAHIRRRFPPLPSMIS